MPNDSIHAGLHGGAPQQAPGAAQPGMAMATPDAETDGDPALPLKRTGLNSAEELRRGLATIGNAEARALFERGFRLTFTTKREARGYREARELLERALALEPKLAEAERAIGYAGFNSGMSMAEVLALYRKAVEMKPDYGEAHYALAFFLGESDPQEGAAHFRRAMQLGVPDERNLRATYYSKIEMH
jgi:tetratricopeptide (TPR) repeat protein